MNTTLTHAIYQTIEIQDSCLSSDIPNEEVITNFIMKAESGNEMAIIFLAEWFHLSKKMVLDSQPSLNQLEPYFM